MAQLQAISERSHHRVISNRETEDIRAASQFFNQKGTSRTVGFKEEIIPMSEIKQTLK